MRKQTTQAQPRSQGFSLTQAKKVYWSLTKKDTKSRIEVFARKTQDFQKWLVQRSDANFDF